MKIKRFFARDMREAMQRIRAEQGEDAVILSSSAVEGGIEVISAMDYDEQALREQAAESDRQAAAAAEMPAADDAAIPPTLRSYLEEQERKLAYEKSFQNDMVVDPLSGVGGDVLADENEDESNWLDAASPDAEAPSERKRSAYSAYGAPEPAPRRERRPLPSLPVEWSQDPAIREMREEMEQMRGLLQEQLNQLAWGDYSRRDPVRAQLFRRLRKLGLDGALAKALAGQIHNTDRIDHAWEESLKKLAQLLPTGGEDMLSSGGVFAMVGATGVGKTTTIAKLAARAVRRYGRKDVALISADQHRIGAHGQLQTYARILNVPLRTADSSEALQEALEAFAERRLVLIDTAGMSPRDRQLLDQFAMLSHAKPIQACLVVSAQAQSEAIEEALRAFRRLRPVAAVVTKLDESHGLGGVLSALVRHRLALHYVSAGQRVPEDLERAHGERLVRYAMNLMRRAEKFAPPRGEAPPAKQGGRVSYA
jgi:flagellar biosynthesis protein FlhF